MSSFKIDHEHIKQDTITLFWITISALLYSIAITSFANVGGFYPGGFAGISRLTTDIALEFFNINLPFWILYAILNILPTIFVYRYIGKRFTIFSVLQYSLVSVFTSFLKPMIALDDPLLIAVFGGLLAGTGIGIALRSNASTGGTDFVAIIISNRFNRSSWSLIMALNASILCIAGLLFSWEQALYSIIYQFVQMQVIDKLHERYKMETLTVMTQHPDEVVEEVLRDTRHGITEFWGEGAYKHQNMAILYTVINSFQRRQVVRSVLKADPKAFINIQRTEAIVGNYYQKPLD